MTSQLVSDYRTETISQIKMLCKIPYMLPVPEVSHRVEQRQRMTINRKGRLNHAASAKEVG